MDLPLYQQLARHMAHAMETGTLKQGDRLPSVRQLAQQHRVSISTALQVYRHLENQRLIEARPKSGYFVRSTTVLIQHVNAFAPLNLEGIQERVYAYYHTARKETAIRLDIAIGDPSLYPARKLQQISNQLLRRHPELLTQYPSTAGYEPLKEQVARRMLTAGCTLSPQDIVFTHGGSEALSLALRSVARAGDTIAVESPVYLGILQVLDSLGMRPLEIPTSATTGLSLDALDVVTQTPGHIAAVISISNFHNPLGCTMPDAHKRKLVHLLNERNIPRIEDDIYGDLHFGRHRPFAAKAWDTTGNVLLCSSASKVAVPGLRIGWIAPGRWQQRVEAHKLSSSRSCATFNQALLAEFMGNGAYDHHLRKLRQALRIQAKHMVQAIRQYFPPGSQVEMPIGGFLVWVQMPPQVDSWEVFERAAKLGIGIAPGCLFSTSTRFNHCVRLSCGLPWNDKLHQAIQTVGAIVSELADKNHSGALSSPLSNQFDTNPGKVKSSKSMATATLL